MLGEIRKGYKLQTIADRHGVNLRTVKRWKAEAGLAPRAKLRKKATPGLIARVATMRAEGHVPKEIGRVLGVSPERVRKILAEPTTQIEVVKRREIAKSLAAEFLPTTTAKAFEMANKALDEYDAKAFDATTRGLHALEKIGSSVSGEDRKMSVEHSGAIETTPQITAIEQLNMLINVVLGKS